MRALPCCRAWNEEESGMESGMAVKAKVRKEGRNSRVVRSSIPRSVGSRCCAVQCCGVNVQLGRCCAVDTVNDLPHHIESTAETTAMAAAASALHRPPHRHCTEQRTQPRAALTHSLFPTLAPSHPPFRVVLLYSPYAIHTPVILSVSFSVRLSVRIPARCITPALQCWSPLSCAPRPSRECVCHCLR